MKKIYILTFIFILAAITSIAMFVYSQRSDIKLNFSDDISSEERKKITEDLSLNEHAKFQIEEGAGITISRKQNCKEQDECFRCKLLTNKFGDYLSCHLSKNDNGTYEVEW